MQMTHKCLLSVGIGAFWLSTQGCISSAVQPTTEQPTSPAVVTITSTETQEPAVTLTIEPTMMSVQPTPTFPAIEGSNVRLFDFIFGSSTSECTLPCWNGLVAEESEPQEIQRVLDTVFGFNDTFDFFDTNAVRIGTKLLDIPDLYATGYVSSYPDNDLYTILALNPVTDKLQGITFHWSLDDTLSVDVTPERVIQELGIPSQIYAQVIRVPIEGKDTVRFLLVYNSGIGFYATTNAPEVDSPPNAIQLCLDDRFPSESYYIGSIYLTAPFPNVVSEMTPFQKGTVQQDISIHGLVPVEQIFNLTAEQLGNAILSGQGKCFVGG